MKNAVLLIFLLATLCVNAQELKKSDAITKEIRELELQNNKLVLEKYMSDNKDTTRCIPIMNLGYSFVNNTIRSKNNPIIDSLEKHVKVLYTERDSIRKSVPEFDKFFSEYMKATNEKRKELGYEYGQQRKKMEETHPEYIEADKKITANRSKYYYLALEILKDDFHSKDKVLPLSFIPYQEQNVYNSDFTIKENQVKIQILNNLYRKTLEEEMNQKYKE